MSERQAFLLGLLLAALPSCADRSVSAIAPEQIIEERVEFSVGGTRDVDILFVIDNSNSMEREQISLAAKFSHLVDVLAEHPDGLPSVHIAVTSTDLGAGQGTGCSAQGDGGNFLGESCGLNGEFLKSIVVEDGAPETNFQGELADTFACMASLGNKGCGFEQPLEAMKRALSSPQANSFLRDDAYLAVVIVTDEDDCSVKDTALLDGTPLTLESPLGPAKSFRCFEFGVECAEKARATGKKTGCAATEESKYLTNVDDYVNFLYELKPYREQVLVASIAGSLDPVDVVMRHDSNNNLDYLALDYSCTEVDAEAVPPIRLNAFLSGFADQSESTSICDKDLSSALNDIADLIVNQQASCIQGNLQDVDPDVAGVQPDCVVVEHRGTESEKRFPECSNTDRPEESEILPCFTLQTKELCSEYPSQLSPQVHYAPGTSVAPNTRISANCLVD